MAGSKEGDPTTASRDDYAQSECIVQYSNSVAYSLQEPFLIVLLFQENKSFGASTICIHPLMYGKLCREQYLLDLIKEYILYLIREYIFNQPDFWKRTSGAIFGKYVHINVRLILKVSEFIFFRGIKVKQIMGHFEVFIEGTETFLTPKLP
jgi:hypothetical protein